MFDPRVLNYGYESTSIWVIDAPMENWCSYNEVFCSTESINTPLPQAQGQLPGQLLIIKTDNTIYPANITAYSGETIAGYPSGITLTNQYDYVSIMCDGTTITKVIASRFTGDGKQDTITSPVANDIVTVNALGQVIDSGVAISTDGTFTADSDSLIPTQKATKTYINTVIAGILDLQGNWNASTNTPTLTAGTGTIGYAYYTSVSGTTIVPSGTLTTYEVGDLVYYASNNIWNKLEASNVFPNINLTNNTNQIVMGNTNTQTVTMATLTSNRTLTLPDANSNTIQPLGSATANNWVQYIDGTGTQNLANPITTTLTSYTATAGKIVATDTILQAFQKTGASLNTTSGQIIVGNVSNIATPVAMSGDTTITNTGITTVSIATNIRNGTTNQIPYQTGTNTTDFIPTANNSVLATSNTGVPSYFTALQTNTLLNSIATGVYYISTTGSDSNNGLSIETAWLTLGHACPLISNSGYQLVLLPGAYSETITISNQNLSITGINDEQGGVVYLTGTITISNTASSIRLTGINFNILNKTGAGSLYLSNCITSTAFNNSGTGYVKCFNSDSQGGSLTGTVSLTGAGTTVFTSACTVGVMTINNAAAVASISNPINCLPITVTSGTLTANTAIIYSASAGTFAVTVANGSVLLLSNVACLLADNATRANLSIAAGAFYTFNDVDYNIAGSTISGTNLLRTLVFDNINLLAPLPITSGGTGQTTAANAINNLVPSQTGNAGKVLSTNATVVSWVTGASTIGNNTITNSLLSQAGSNTWKGNNTGSTANEADNSAGALTESTSSILTITGGNNALLNATSIQVNQANNLQSGYLSSTDWNIFNNTSHEVFYANITSNSNISGTFSSGSFTGMPNTAIDSTALYNGMIVLLGGQTSQLQNGLYTITSVGTGANGIWTRLSTFITDAEIRNSTIFVQSGTNYLNTWWRNVNFAPLTINTDPLLFSQTIGNENYLPDSYVCSSLNITILSGSQTIDGVASGTNVFVLLTAQSTATNNGPWWVPTSGAWVRPSFFMGIVSSGLYQNVRYSGGGQNNGVWQITNGSSGTSATINVGTDNIQVTQVSSTANQSAWRGRNLANGLPVLNANGIINNVQLGGGFTTTVTSAGTTILTNASTGVQQFTGTTTQTVVLPQANLFPALPDGITYTIENLSTGSITVNTNGGSLLTTVSAGTDAILTLTNNSTSAGTWHLLTLPSTGGTVTSVSVVSANGFAGTVATATTTPAITLSTSITGLLKGNGTAISAAVANTDYQAPLTNPVVSTSALPASNTFPVFNGTGDQVAPNTITQTNLLLKPISFATSNYSMVYTDYTIEVRANNLTINAPVLSANVVAGQEFILKNKNFVGTTFATTDGSLFDGVPSITLNAYYSITIKATVGLTGWDIINWYPAILAPSLIGYIVTTGAGYPDNGMLIVPFGSSYGVLLGNTGTVNLGVAVGSPIPTTGTVQLLNVASTTAIYLSTGVLVLAGGATTNYAGLLIGDNGNIYDILYDGTSFTNTSVSITSVTTPTYPNNGYLISKVNATTGNAEILIGTGVTNYLTV